MTEINFRDANRKRAYAYLNGTMSFEEMLLLGIRDGSINPSLLFAAAGSEAQHQGELQEHKAPERPLNEEARYNGFTKKQIGAMSMDEMQAMYEADPEGLREFMEGRPEDLTIDEYRKLSLQEMQKLANENPEIFEKLQKGTAELHEQKRMVNKG